MVGTSLYRRATHLAQARALSMRDELAIALMEEGHGDVDVVLAGDLDDGVDFLK